MNQRRLLIAAIVTVGTLVQPAPAKGQSVDLTCYSRIGGSWNFGTAPSACRVSNSGPTSTIASEYSPVVFQDSHTSTTGRRAYLSTMFPVLRETATYYIKRRNPSVTDSEVAGFLAGVFALAEQETLWTHYRLGTDNTLRYMRGDNLHGHGVMQVDDRSHVAALKQGKGIDLVYNLMYGLDVYYSAWVRSATARCISSRENYHDRARAAWAAYNGGPAKLCRWQGNGSTDQSFNKRYVRQAWLSYVEDPRAASRLNVRCLAEGIRPCTLGDVTP